MLIIFRGGTLVEGKKLNWEHPYLGWNIDREVNPKKVVDYLLKNKYCGIANGRAEFGLRALGNREFDKVDPRYDVKDTVNEIKQRQKFRPFAPMILEEHFDDYFISEKIDTCSLLVRQNTIIRL